MVLSNEIIYAVLILGIITIFHLLTIFFTWRIGKAFGLSHSWNLIVLAFIILLSRRVIAFLDLFEVISYSDNLIIQLERVYIPLVFWVLMGIGMIFIYYKLRSSMEVERKVKNVHKRLSKKRK